MADIDAIDNFINDASDQAAAWYSIVTQKDVALPSTQIEYQRRIIETVGTPAGDPSPVVRTTAVVTSAATDIVQTPGGMLIILGLVVLLAIKLLE